MLTFPNSKINLGLHVLRKREDGFHDMETIFCPVGLCDALEFIPQPDQHAETTFSCTGLPIDGNESDNLCVKAYRLLQKDHPQLPALQIHLHKAIPMGAGLGGGSADAAFLLKSGNEKFRLALSPQQLNAYALQLGSDCAFFLNNKPCFARGRGELLEEISIDLRNYHFVLVYPKIHINTAWAFSQLTPSVPERSIKAVIQQPVSRWKDELTNNFEGPVFKTYPEIKNIKAALYEQGAIYAALSGSGSTVFGIFETTMKTPQFPDKNYFIYTAKVNW